MKKGNVKVRLIFADHGAYQIAEVPVPSAALQKHERLIDCLREDPTVLRSLHVDMGRLVAAHVVDE